ncbi:SOS response-associated peptidase [Laceyella tengchongensis]|jgi:putative SOS response-associated peptidase YedK|uniref:SOS response-associated peptidase n=1 Tax=Laceyella tengchongensis TaxID=574699 RepID=UPI0012BA0B25|nr:SOS response-associated peptidase [Laceyella tengchongensis]
MCGRFSLSAELDQLERQFEMMLIDEVSPRYNIAPTQPILSVVLEEGARVGRHMRWGLVPGWAKDVKIGYKMINARAETLDEKPTFKGLLKRRRCLILADGFYEWKKTGNEKQPYRFQMADGKPFAFAGLWNHWNHEDKTLVSCTIITTAPNAIAKEVHDRMPAILRSEDYETWLHPDMEDLALLKSLLQPYPADEMEAYPVSTRVNSPKNDDPSILLPLAH